MKDQIETRDPPNPASAVALLRRGFGVNGLESLSNGLLATGVVPFALLRCQRRVSSFGGGLLRRLTKRRACQRSVKM